MINGIVTKVVALIGAALPSYTRVDAFYTATTSLDSGDFPLAMVFDPTVTSVRLRERQKDQTTSVAVVLIRSPGEGVEIRDDLDAVVDALEADPTLTQTVDDARAAEWGSSEGQKAQTIGGMNVEIQVVT